MKTTLVALALSALGLLAAAPVAGAVTVAAPDGGTSLPILGPIPCC